MSWEAEAGGLLELEVWDQLGNKARPLSLPKNNNNKKKFAGQSGPQLQSQLLRRLRRQDYPSPWVWGCRDRTVPLHSRLSDSQTPFLIKIFFQNFTNNGVRFCNLGFTSILGPLSLSLRASGSIKLVSLYLWIQFSWNPVYSICCSARNWKIFSAFPA